MHPDVRQRQNATSTMNDLPQLGAEDRAAIEVPDLPAERLWDLRVQTWWRDAWQSPMRLEWDPADTHALLQIAYLLDLFYLAVDVPLSGDADPASELERVLALDKKVAAVTRLSQAIMNRSARIGIDPFSRRSLQWRLVEIEKAEATTAETRARTKKIEASTPAPRRKRGLAGLQ